jgi:hypothetical protein
MGKKFLWLFLCCIMAVTLVAWSCGGTQNSEQEEEEEEEEDGTAWSDFPSYPGAVRQYEAFSVFPTTGIETYTWEWRYYRTDDSTSDVKNYYRNKMPEYGWDETGSTNLGSYTRIIYEKNHREDMAYVLIASDHGETIMALSRGHAE